MADEFSQFQTYAPPAPSADEFASFQPFDINAAVKAGYQRSGQLAAEGQQASQDYAKQQAHPILDEFAGFEKATGGPELEAGAGRLLSQVPGLQGIGQNMQAAGEAWNQIHPNAPIASTIGKGVGMVPGLNPILGGATSGLESYGGGESGIQAVAHGAINTVVGKLLQAGISKGIGDTIAQQLSGYARPLIAKLGARGAIGALTQLANAGANNLVSGRPFLEGAAQNAGLGGVLEAGFGAVGDAAGKPQNDEFAGFEPVSQENKATSPTQANVPAPGKAVAPPAQESEFPASFASHTDAAKWYGDQFNDTKNSPMIETMLSQSPGKYVKADIPIDRIPSRDLMTGDTDLKKVAEFAAHPTETRPPVMLFGGENGGQYDIADGGHRVEAARVLGEPTISAYVPEGSVPKVTNANDPLENAVSRSGGMPDDAEFSRPTLSPVDTVAKFVAGKINSSAVSNNLFGGVPFREWAGGIANRVATSISNFIGGDVGRSGQANRTISNLQAHTSATNQIGLRLNSLYEPFTTMARNMMANGKASQLHRAIDEIESGQRPSDPAFHPLADLIKHSGTELKDAAVKAGIVGAKNWNESQILRSFSQPDANGKAPWEAGYTAPPATGTGRSLQGGWSGYSRRVLGGYADALTAAGGHGLVESHPDPITAHFAKQFEIWKLINAKGMANDELAAGRIHKVEGSQKATVGEKRLDDRLFNPNPRRWSGDPALVSKLNDQSQPIGKRLSDFRQAIKDGSLTELPPPDPNEAMERYAEGVFTEPGETREGQVREKYTAAREHATGTFQQGPKFKTGYDISEPGNQATGEYSPAIKGSLPKGHMIVDDALAQADRPFYTAQGDIADVLNHHLEPSPTDSRNPISNGYKRMNDAVLGAKFGLSGVHYSNLQASAMSGRFGEGVNQLLHGRVGEATSAFKSAVPVKNAVELINAGRAFHDAMTSPEANAELTNTPYKSSLATPEEKMGLAAQLAVKGGGVVETPNLLKPQEKPIGFGFGSLVRASQKLLFEKYGENLRRGAMLRGIQDEMEKASRDGTSLSDPRVQARIKNTVNSTFDIFDTIRQDRGFQSKASSAALKAVFAYPNWTISKARLLARSISDIPQALKDRDMSPAQKQVAGNLIMTALAGGALQYAATGKAPTKFTDFFYPTLWGGKKWVLPGPMMPLISLALGGEGIGGWLENRMQPSLQVAGQLIQNKDYRNVHTRDTIGDTINTIRNTVQPAWGSDLGSNDSILSKIGNFFGVRHANERLNWSPAEAALHDILASKAEAGGKTVEEQEHRDTFNELLRSLVSNDPDARQNILKAHQQGEISDVERKDILKYAKQGTGIGGLVNRKEISGRDLAKIWPEMSDAEKAATRGTIRRKISEERSLTPGERSKLYQEVGQ